MADLAEVKAPFLTAGWPGIGGRIKKREEDFLVDEIPLYPPCGEGTHVFIHIEKKSCTTMNAMNKIARILHKSPRYIGYAGLKDARAVTRQWLSIEHVDPARIEALNINHIKILGVTRHTNKIKIGHLAGNHFDIKVRQCDVPQDECLRRATAILDILTQRGIPNYFGEQRFGNRGDYHLLGAAIIRCDPQEFLDLLLGRPHPSETEAIQKARQFYEERNYEQAIQYWPYDFFDQIRALRTLIQTEASPEKTFNGVDKRQQKFFVSSFQSLLFNQVLAARMPDIDQIMQGDMAWKHDNGACFLVEDVAAEQPRCLAREISPTGPIFGYKMAFPQGAPGEIEREILGRTHLNQEDFREATLHKAGGCRRPLRFLASNASVSAGDDDAGPYIQLSFDLPSGCYATTLLREITKSELSGWCPDETSADNTTPTA